MSDMQVSVRFRRETGADCLVFSLCQVLFYNLFNKVLGNYFFFHYAPPQFKIINHWSIKLMINM